jgi:DNA-binding transcriptional LysR family regulator
MRYSLKHIEVFLSVAKYENVSIAAEQLAMSQSAVSESLKTLESQFNIQLFDRVGKKLVLSELGRSLIQETNSVFERAKHLQNSFAQQTGQSKLNIGATLSIGNYLAVQMISRYKQAFPSAQIQLDVANTTDIADRVLNYELDVGLIEGEINHPDLVVESWLDDELVVFCSPEHSFATVSELNDEQLKQAAWVLRESGSGTRQAFDYAMHGIISDLNISIELQHTEAIKRAVECNIGIGCLSRITLKDAFKRGSLIPLNVHHRNFKRAFYLIHHKDKYMSKGILSWLELCKNMSAIQHK